MNKIIIAVCTGVIFGYGIALIAPSIHPKLTQSNAGELNGQIVLGRLVDGTFHETGLKVPYDITGTFPGALILLSPNKTRALFTTWEMAKINLYVSDINGNNIKKIAQQEVPEGSGGLNVSSIHWTDATHVTYIEGGSICKEGCDPSHPPQTKIMNYSVDVVTGEKTLVSTEIR